MNAKQATVLGREAATVRKHVDTSSSDFRSGPQCKVQSGEAHRIEDSVNTGRDRNISRQRCLIVCLFLTFLTPVRVEFRPLSPSYPTDPSLLPAGRRDEDVHSTTVEHGGFCQPFCGDVFTIISGHRRLQDYGFRLQLFARYCTCRIIFSRKHAQSVDKKPLRKAKD